MSKLPAHLESRAREQVSESGLQYLQRLEQRQEAAAEAPFTVDETELFREDDSFDSSDPRADLSVD
jgi:chemotaxis methyl-accepting protein methylase